MFFGAFRSIFGAKVVEKDEALLVYPERVLPEPCGFRDK
jgi:hypothetical protein